MTFKHEPEICFPARPYEAAIVFVAAIAYPELGAGLPDQRGSEFAHSILKFGEWARTKSQTLKEMRKQLGDPSYVAPREREFIRKFESGRRRISRRIAAYEIVGTQLLGGFLSVVQIGRKAIADGRADKVFDMASNEGFSPIKPEIWRKSVLSPRQIIAGSERRWSEKLGLNVTGSSADPLQKSRDLYQRAFLTSRPVLHMVHALNQCAYEIGPSLPRWGQRDPVIAMVFNAEAWIWKALEIAEQWRTMSHYAPGLAISPDDMIAIVPPGDRCAHLIKPAV